MAKIEEKPPVAAAPEDKDAQIAAMRAELDAAKALLAERAVIEAAPLTGLYAKCRILHGATVIEAGAALPFDPSNEAAAKAGGFEGLVEGVHWERGR